MKKKIFSGVATALITPFRGNEIDYTAFGKIIDFQISAGIDALVVGGTTGEASCLDFDEKARLYSYAINRTGGRIPVILGAGSNDTRSAIRLTRLAKELGADGALVVTPYYNLGTKSGIEKHYLNIAESADLPIIIYNVPSRTGVNIEINTLITLAEHQNIVAIKEASDSCRRIADVCALSDKMCIYSGNDASTLLMLSLGGDGVISVISNLLPGQTLRITSSYFDGRTDDARAAHVALLPIIRAMFVETNPAPIKYAMSLMKLCCDEMRLPLSAPCEATAGLIERELNKFFKK